MFNPTDLSFSSSRLGRYWQSLVVVLAVLAVALTALPLFTRCILVTLILLSVGVTYALSTEIRRLQWQLKEGGMRVSEGYDWLEVERVDSILVTRFVIFMRLHIRQRYLPVPLVVWRDRLSTDDFRRFSVAVRFGKPPQHVESASAQNGL